MYQLGCLSATVVERLVYCIISKSVLFEIHFEIERERKFD